MAIKPIEILIRARDEAGSILTGVQAKVTAVAATVATLLGAGLFAGAVRSAAGLEEAMSPRSVVQSCKSCSSCFPNLAGRVGKNQRFLLLQI